MIQVDKDWIKVEGDIDTLIGEVCAALRELYNEAKKAFGDEPVDEWLDELPSYIRLTDEEIEQEFWERMLDDGDWN